MLAYIPYMDPMGTEIESNGEFLDGIERVEGYPYLFRTPPIWGEKIRSSEKSMNQGSKQRQQKSGIEQHEAWGMNTKFSHGMEPTKVWVQ